VYFSFLSARKGDEGNEKYTFVCEENDISNSKPPSMKV